MARQASEVEISPIKIRKHELHCYQWLVQVINLVVTLVEALTTSMSQRSFPDYAYYADSE